MEAALPPETLVSYYITTWRYNPEDHYMELHRRENIKPRILKKRLTGNKMGTQHYQRGPFEKFVDSPYYSESELCGGAVTVSFSKYLPWQAMHFLQRSTHFSKT
jgi:hypothetical protein